MDLYHHRRPHEALGNKTPGEWKGMHGSKLYAVHTFANPSSSGPWPTFAYEFDLCTKPVFEIANLVDTIVCRGTTVTLNASGSLNDATGWNWYETSCGGTLSGTLSSLDFVAQDTLTYYLNASGGCVGSTLCDSITIYVKGTKPEITPAWIGPVMGLTVMQTYTSYQWYLNDIAIPNANGQNWIPLANGSYTVKVTDSSGCEGMSESHLIDDVTGIAGIENDHSQVNIYPNPARHQIKINTVAAATLTIFSIDGRILKMEQLNKGINTIELKNMSPGFYLLNIKATDGRIFKTEKLIVR